MLYMCTYVAIYRIFPRVYVTGDAIYTLNVLIYQKHITQAKINTGRGHKWVT